MKLLDVKAVLDRDVDIQQTDCDRVVLKELDDKSTRYAILSHRWGIEVGYEEMAGLMKMEEGKRNEIRRCDGYQKIIKSCEQAMKDGYEWLWIDTCCIDKRSSSELSEAINSMYQWYRNAQVCYVYLHDVDGSTFPTQRNNGKFRESNGWPEWFVRGWTLQELIAPKQVEFFNKDWLPIGNKRWLAPKLHDITGIPLQVFWDGLGAQRLSVAQIMSWAAGRKTTRVEDRAYSLLGLFGVNMPMLYGEGNKAFRRLQLEIIRESNDHSIFAWNPQEPRPGSVLAASPSDFRDCCNIQKVKLDKFADGLIEHVEKNKLSDPGNMSSRCGIIRAITIRRRRRAHQRKLAALHDAARSQQLGTFSVSNAGIQVWLPVIPCRDHFTAILACSSTLGHLVTIDLVSSGSSFDRIFGTADVPKTYPEFKALYLTHQGASEAFREFVLDDKTTSYHGFIRCGTFPREFRGDTVSLSSLTNDLILIVYANDNVRSRFAIGLGYHLGQGWVHIICDEHPVAQMKDWEDFARGVYNRMWNARAEHAQSMPKHSEGGYWYHRDNFIKHAHLPRSIYAARVVWGRWEMDDFKLMIDVEQCPGCCTGPRRWTTTSNDRHGVGMSGFMKTALHRYQLKVDGWWIQLNECSGQRIVLGDYGDYSSGKFKCDGNIFEDMGILGIDATDPAYCPVVSRVSDSEHATRHMESQNDLDMIHYDGYKHHSLYQPKGLLLPTNEHFVLLLKTLSTRLTGQHLVTAVIQSLDICGTGDEGKRRNLRCELAVDSGNLCTGPAILTPLYTIASPQVWRREPACTRRREQITNIQEHFYALLKMHQPPGTEPRRKSANRQKSDGPIKFFSDMFGLKYLINYVGEITFFRRLPSMIATDLLSEPSAGALEEDPLPACRPKSSIVSRVMTCNLLKGKTDKGPSKDPRLEAVLPPLLRRCRVPSRRDDVPRRHADKVQEIVHEVKSLSQTLGTGLIEYISATFALHLEGKDTTTGRANHIDYDRQLNTRSVVQEIIALQAKLDGTKDKDEQRALGEDVTGKILWFCWCGICAEVDELLPKVPNYIWREGALEGLLEIRRIIEEAHTELDDDQAHLQRIMFDAGAGTSKYQLLLTARVAEQVKWSGATTLGDTSIREATPSTSVALGNN